MKVTCKRCDAKAHSKCPYSRRVFRDGDIEDQVEDAFFHTFSFRLGDANLTNSKDTKALTMEMLVYDADLTEAAAFEQFVKRIKGIPDDRIKRYACVHSWQHTQDCGYCGWKKGGDDERG